MARYLPPFIVAVFSLSSLQLLRRESVYCSSDQFVFLAISFIHTHIFKLISQLVSRFYAFPPCIRFHTLYLRIRNPWKVTYIVTDDPTTYILCHTQSIQPL